MSEPRRARVRVVKRASSTNNRPASPKSASRRGKGKAKKKFVAFVPTVRREALRDLHKALDLALPVPSNKVTVEALKALDAECWIPGLTADEFRTRYLRASVLKRWQGGSRTDKEAQDNIALQKLLDSEIRCTETNRIFTGPESLDWSNARIPPHLIVVFKRARCVLDKILGRFDWEEFPHCVEFSSGATTEFPRKSSAVTNKWETGTHITPKALPYGVAFRKWLGLPYPSQDDRSGQWPEFQVTEHNVVFTVPKNFATNRTACKGTTWNTALQKAVGTMIRTRCQRFAESLLLPSAQEYHGILAKLGSKAKHLNTGDLVGASNGVTVGHCLTFFASDWSNVMMDLREDYGIMPDGTPVRWEMLSSMGNGYTFEVETAFFYALVKACCGSKSLVSVYGDDLIYPDKYHDLVIEAFAYAGFEFNREKTFGGDHPFRESCGEYYFDGIDVKPFYIEKLPCNVEEIILLHNDIVGWHRGVPDDGPWAEVIRLCRAIVAKKYWGPLGVVGVLWAEWDETTPDYHPRYQAWSVRGVVQELTSTETDQSIGRFLASLWEGNARRVELEPQFHELRPTCGTLTGCPMWDIVRGADSGGEGIGYESKPNTKLRWSRRFVDRVQWETLSVSNIRRWAGDTVQAGPIRPITRGLKDLTVLLSMAAE